VQPEAALSAHPKSSAFGPWYRRQRELRGISIFFVAARTKLSPERVREIEEESAPLDADGIGRSTARTLALAIGADPDEAAAQLGRPRRVRIPHRARFAHLPAVALRWAVRAGSVALLAVAVWLLSLWLARPSADANAPGLVYKPDYVDKLLKRN
jgi:hypothetical protein